MTRGNRGGWFGRARWAGLLVGTGLTLFLAPIVAQAQDSCIGDCNGNGSVAVNEIIILVNIVLGTKHNSDCPHGVGATMAVNVTTILKAVNNDLNSTCVPPGTGTPSPSVIPTATPTSGSVTPAICGNGTVEAGEDCDDGGTCIGGDNAGAHCTGDSQCMGQGVCQGGSKAEWACDTNTDCPGGGACVKCVPQGGDGCAANCTAETDVPFSLKPGMVDMSTGNIVAGTSGATVQGDSLKIPLPLQGSQTFTVGKLKNGIIPVVVKAASVQFPAINVGGIACACVRAQAAKTCGGTLFNKDGTGTVDCTPNFTAGDSLCSGAKPCTFVHGPGNSATGVVGCSDSGLAGVNLSFTQDDSDGSGTAPPSITLSGNGPAGSAVLLNSTAIGTTTGACSGAMDPNGPYGADGMFCTPDDPQSTQGMVATLPLTTGNADAEFTNANGIPDDTICVCSDNPPSLSCSASPSNDPHCTGPLMVTGAPISCMALQQGNLSGGSIVGAFTAPKQQVLNDSVVTNVFFAQ